MFYSLARKILFQLDPEHSHTLALKGLQITHQLGLSSLLAKPISNPRTVMGMTFPNSVGLAAGLDKNADYVDALAALGFGFLEVGTVTPKPQEGNPKPRLFRLVKEEAIINRMGFNNKGVEHMSRRLQKIKYKGILGINLGKNKDTPLDRSIDDYLIGFRELGKFASYITINISSPNTPGLRDLQQADFLPALLADLKKEQALVAKRDQKYIPLVVKIAPDLSPQELEQTAHILLQQRIDGVIATNTTISRQGVEASPYAKEMGGLSGRPLTDMNTRCIQQLHAILQNKIPIIAVGGIMDETSARAKLNAGAALLQIYTGFIFNGPELINRLAGIK